MKTNLALALLAFSIIGVNLKAADLPTALPEFMNPSQLAKWNADKTAASASTTVSVGDSDVFFTGKPYLAEAGGYVFKYRTYSPEMSRWTSADPSGFPDGSNNHLYSANQPTSQFDPTGFTTVNISGVPNSATSGRLSITPLRSPTYTNDSTGIQGFFYTDFSVTGLSGSNTSLAGDTLQSNGSLQNSSGSSVAYYGFVVQDIQISYSVANANGSNADNTMYATNPSQYPTSFYEAWLVGLNGVVYAVNQTGGGTLYTATQSSTGATDSFISPLFSPNTHGYYNVTGTVDVYSLSAVGTSGPATWGNVAASGANPSTTSQPGWWGGTGYNHVMQMSWSE